MKGTIIGITPVHRPEHICRAIMEANGFTLRRILELARESGVSVDQVISIGGGSKSGQWLQIRSDITKLPMVASKTAEATTVGSAMLAMMMTGVPADQLPSARVLGGYQPNRVAEALYDGFYGEYLRLMAWMGEIYHCL
jgi:xylulokinase